MRNNALALITVLYFLFCSCQEKNKVNTISCDAETCGNTDFVGFTNCSRFANTHFEKGNTRSESVSKSGNFSIRLNRDCPFGMTYIIRNVQAKEHFQVSIWKNSDSDKACLVASCDNSTAYFMLQNKTSQTFGEWSLLSFDVIIPRSAQGKDLRIFAWNNSTSETFYFDDMSITYLGFAQDKKDLQNSNFTDLRDGKTYSTVKIGNDWWMAENLAFEKQNISSCYENNPQNCTLYGCLYTYDDAVNACPKGWKIPTDQDWKNLEQNCGLTSTEAIQFGWRGQNSTTALLEFGSSGLNIKYAGVCADGYYGLHQSTCFWTATPIGKASAYCREIAQNTAVGRFTDLKKMKFSVRCIKAIE